MLSAAGTEFIFKVPVVGSRGVGKTLLVQQMARHAATVAATPTLTDVPAIQGDTEQQPTVGVDFFSATLPSFKPDMHVRLQFWDTAGDATPSATALTVALRNAAAVLVVYDVTRPTTLEDARTQWLPLVLKNRQIPPQCVFLVGNQTDQLEVATHAVDYEAVEAIADQFDVTPMDCSAVQGTNVAAVLGTICDILVGPYEGMPLTSDASPPTSRMVASGAAAAVPQPAAATKTKLPDTPKGPSTTKNNDGSEDLFSDPDDSSKGTPPEKPKPISKITAAKKVTAPSREPRDVPVVNVNNMAPASDEDDAQEEERIDSDDSSAPRLRREREAKRRAAKKAKAKSMCGCFCW